MNGLVVFVVGCAVARANHMASTCRRPGATPLSTRVEWGKYMLDIRKTAIALEEGELLELEQIVIDRDEKDALRFLKRSVYDKVAQSQQGKLKSHLDTGGDPVERFKAQR